MQAVSASRKLVASVLAKSSWGPQSRTFAAEAGASKVLQPKSREEYLQAIKTAGSKTVSYFTASWCGPCRAIAPLIDKLSLDFSQVAFLKLDIDNQGLHDVAMQHQVASVPTFVFKNGETVVSRCVGADPKGIAAGVEKLV